MLIWKIHPQFIVQNEYILQMKGGVVVVYIYFTI
jgi:hypothetical protein